MGKLHTHYKLGLVGATLLAGTMNSSAEAETLFGGAETLFGGAESLFEGAGNLFGETGITGELSAGYDSKYFYRGLFFGDDNLWSGVEFSGDITETLSASVSAYYLDVIADGDGTGTDSPFRYSESGVSGALSWDTGAGVFDLGITHFQFFDGFDGNGAGQRDSTELSLTYTTDLLFGIEGYGQAVYDLRINAWYFEVGLSRSFALTSYASLDLSAAAGFSVGGYFTSGGVIGGPDFDSENGLTHVLLSAALPIQLLDNVTFSSHASLNISGDSRDGANDALGQDDVEFFGGASIAVSF